MTIELSFLWLLAAGSLLQLHPAADLPHVVAVLPAALPLLAHSVDRFLAAGAAARLSRVRAALPSLAALAVGAALVFPCLQILAQARLARPRPLDGFARATGIWNDGPTFRRAVELVRFLQSREGGPMLVLANQQMLYFLAARNSALPADEHALYLVGADLIADADARALIDEERVIDRLRTTRCLIVDTPQKKPSLSFRRAFPAVARYIESEYAPVRRFGDYQVLAPREDQTG
jgi:hypothetical protein